VKQQAADSELGDGDGDDDDGDDDDDEEEEEAARAGEGGGSDGGEESRDRDRAAPPLWRFAQGGDANALARLLAPLPDARGSSAAVVDLPWRGGVCALLVAAAGGYAACCALLLDAGADPNRSDAAGTTPLMMAAQVRVRASSAVCTRARSRALCGPARCRVPRQWRCRVCPVCCAGFAAGLRC
jgi:hypothetical protein